MNGVEIVLILRIIIFIGCIVTLGAIIFSFKKDIAGLTKSTRKSPNEYKREKIGDIKPNKEQQGLIKRNRELLSHNQVPLNKIRFVLNPMFSYDIDKNEINPKYEVMIPLRTDGSGLFDKDAPIIEIGKPDKIMSVCVNSYRVDDNYKFIKETLKKSKRGIAIFIMDEMCVNMNGTTEPYHSSVDSEVIRFINLDDAVELYEKQTYENESL